MKDREFIANKIRSHLSEVIKVANAEALTNDASLREFPEYDSLGILESLVWLEEEFDITIPDDDLSVDRFDTVGKMTDFVMASQGKMG